MNGISVPGNQSTNATGLVQVIQLHTPRSPLLSQSLSSIRFLLILCLVLQANNFTALAQSSAKRASTPSLSPTFICESPHSTPIKSAQTASSSRVIVLSWNASVPSPAHAKAEGYCLYRSQKESDAKLEAKCSKCALLTPSPLTDTSCVDNAVANGSTYYYIVAAVNQGGMSSPSNEAFAFVNADKPTNSPPKGIPFCGGTNLVKNKPTQ